MHYEYINITATINKNNNKKNHYDNGYVYYYIYANSSDQTIWKKFIVLTVKLEKNKRYFIIPFICLCYLLVNLTLKYQWAL